LQHSGECFCIQQLKHVRLTVVNWIVTVRSETLKEEDGDMGWRAA